MIASQILSLTAFSLALTAVTACGADPKARKDPSLAEGSQSPRHDFSATWVYAVGEVDAPTTNDCRKALDFAAAEADCVGAVCKYGSNLLKDFQAVCRKLTTPAQRQQANELRSTLSGRATQKASECAQKADDWLDRGCGNDGTCESEIRQWATRCSDELKSPLAMHLLERLVENSLREPRRVKFDVQGCVAAKKQLAEAAQCSQPFECEGALRRIDEYVERCAEGNHSGLPLEQAAQVMRIRFGANKATDPISLAKNKTKVVSQKGLLAFADGTGAVVHLCDEPVTDLKRYLEQRRKCTNGEVTVFESVETSEGTNLEVRHLRHESDASFAAAHPSMMVQGEADLRR